MATTKIMIDGIEVALHSSGATYIQYKSEFGLDLFKEFAKFEKTEDEPDGSAIESLTRAAYVMAKQAYYIEHAAGEPFPSFIDWCDQFSFLGLAKDIPKVAPILMADRQTTEEAKKKN